MGQLLGVTPQGAGWLQLWRYAQRWWRWHRAGLDGRVARVEKGRNTTIEDAGHCGIPYPDIRSPDRHLADAEVVSLGLKLRICQVSDITSEVEQLLGVTPHSAIPEKKTVVQSVI